MNAEELLRHYERVADAPDAATRLRRFVLDLAIRGKLVPPNPIDEPADLLLERLLAERERRIAAGEFREPSSATLIEREKLPFSPPPHWRWARLIDLAEPSYGFAFASGQFNASKRGMPLIRIRDISGIDTEAYFDGPFDPAYLVSPGDYLVGMDGDFNLRRWRGKPGLLNQRVLRINGWRCGVSPEFVKLPLQFILDHLHGQTSQTTVKHLSAKQVNGIEVPLPPLAEQHRIVAKVDELMALCDRLEAARAEREAARDRLAGTSLARLRFPDPQTFADDARILLDAWPAVTARDDQIRPLRDTVCRMALLGRFSGEDLWPKKPSHLREFVRLQSGYAFKSEWFGKGGVRLLRNANVGHGRVNWADEAFLPEELAKDYSRFVLNAGDIVLSLNRPFISTGTKVAQVHASDLPALLVQRVARLDLSEGLLPEYLLLWLKCTLFQEQVQPVSTNVAPHIAPADICNARIFVPGVEEQRRVVDKVKQLMQVCDQLEASLEATAGYRACLLEALLRSVLDSSRCAVASASADEAAVA